MKIHLLDPEDESGILILSMPEIDMYVEFDSSGNASVSSKTDEELLACKQTIFESEIYSRIDFALGTAPNITEEEKIFKGQLLIMKAMIADKNYDNEM
jgi:hypothetical protein